MTIDELRNAVRTLLVDALRSGLPLIEVHDAVRDEVEDQEWMMIPPDKMEK